MYFFFSEKWILFCWCFFSTWMVFGSLKRKGQPKHPFWAPKPWTAPCHDSATWPLTRRTSQPASSPMLDGRLRYLSINLRDRDLSEGLCDWFSTAIFCCDWMNQNVIGLIKADHLFWNFPLWLKDEALPSLYWWNVIMHKVSFTVVGFNA